MPPVLGPVSPSPTLLKSCAASSGTTVSPSTTQNSDTSGPSRNDSSSTGCPASSRLAACALAASRSAVTTTPLPAARPSSLTTHAASPPPGPNRSNAASRRAGLSTISLVAVRTPAADITSLANDFDPSMRAASFVGPKQAIPAARTASATPSTRGTSGPITTRSAPIFWASADDLVAGGDVDLVLVGDRRGAGVAGRDRQGSPPRGLCAARAAAHVHGHRIRSRGRARLPTLIAPPRDGAPWPFS